MKALILNSGLGSRLGAATKNHPKCMTKLSEGETILGRQLGMLHKAGVENIVITTGFFDRVLMDYCDSLEVPEKIEFVHNPVYGETNYIYSIYCAREKLKDDILLLHGDLVFEQEAINCIVNSDVSCMAAAPQKTLPEKDFKAVVLEGRIVKIGVECFENAVAVQPLYLLKKKDWKIWLESICRFCEAGKRNCYAEDAFNEVSDHCFIYPKDVGDLLCQEVDDQKDLRQVRDMLGSQGAL
ncbi:MAG: phosphocholine cytidylyltransferase family protein [Roseburia sp.]|nr:phosphocholine cytidylyltransferase family protein [Roseburia sp.]